MGQNTHNFQREQALSQANEMLQSLSDEQLEQVAGGGLGHWIKKKFHQAEQVADNVVDGIPNDAKTVGKLALKGGVAGLKGLAQGIGGLGEE